MNSLIEMYFNFFTKYLLVLFVFKISLYLIKLFLIFASLIVEDTENRIRSLKLHEMLPSTEMEAALSTATENKNIGLLNCGSDETIIVDQEIAKSSTASDSNLKSQEVIRIEQERVSMYLKDVLL